MSGLVKLKLPAGGSKTISAPDSASDETITLPAGTKTLLATDGDGSQLTNLPAGGKVLQVVQTVKSDSFTATDGAYYAITGLSASITPTSTTSKILISCQVTTTDDNNYPPMFHIHKNGTKVTPTGSTFSWSPNHAYAMLAIGQTATSTLSFEYLDSPASTSALTYQVYGAKPSVSVFNLKINTPWGGSSVITLMEIGA